MTVLLHLSDLHFGPAYQPVVGNAVLRFAERLQPDAVVVSGDFTQRATADQFRDARAYLQELPNAPQVVIPGNHDVPLYRIHERIASPYALYRKYISEELDTVTELPGVVIVALNSTAPLRATVNGRVHRWQLDFARGAFEGVPPASQRVVVAHHHFAPPPDFEGGDVMPKAKRALDAFTEMRVDVILGGHLHRAYVGNSLDVYAGEDREHGIAVVQSGTSTSRRGRAREREKNSFNVLKLDKKFIRVTHYMYFDPVADFVATSRHVFFRRGSPTLDADEQALSDSLPDF